MCSIKERVNVKECWWVVGGGRQTSDEKRSVFNGSEEEISPSCANEQQNLMTGRVDPLHNKQRKR